MVCSSLAVVRASLPPKCMAVVLLCVVRKLFTIIAVRSLRSVSGELWADML